MIHFCDMGAASLDEDGVLLVQCKGASVGGDNDTPDFGEVPSACALGITAMPYPATDAGSAEGLIETDTAGVDGVLIGARDTRTAGIVKNLKPGDTVVHSTGPQQAAQLQLKEEKRQACLMSKDKRGKDIGLIIDGEAEKVTLSAFGHILEFSRTGIRLVDKAGAAVTLSSGAGYYTGTVVLGGRTPSAPVLSGTTLSPIPTPGVFVGIG